MFKQEVKTVKQEFYINLLEQFGLIKTVYYKLFYPIRFTILVADIIYGFCGLHLTNKRVIEYES